MAVGLPAVGPQNWYVQNFKKKAVGLPAVGLPAVGPQNWYVQNLIKGSVSARKRCYGSGSARGGSAELHVQPVFPSFKEGGNETRRLRSEFTSPWVTSPYKKSKREDLSTQEEQLSIQEEQERRQKEASMIDLATCPCSQDL